MLEFTTESNGAGMFSFIVVPALLVSLWFFAFGWAYAKGAAVSINDPRSNGSIEGLHRARLADLEKAAMYLKWSAASALSGLVVILIRARWLGVQL